MGSFCRDVCGGLERQSGTRFALPSRHHKSMSCPTLAPTKLVYVCTEQALFLSRRVGIAHSSPPTFIYLFIFIGGPGCDWDCVLSMHVAGHPEEYITLLRLMVVASSRLLIVTEEAI